MLLDTGHWTPASAIYARPGKTRLALNLFYRFFFWGFTEIKEGTCTCFAKRNILGERSGSTMLLAVGACPNWKVVVLTSK